MSDFHRVTLGNIGNGGAEEIFQRELQKVLNDIADPNTRAEPKRKIDICIEFHPYESRDKCEVLVTYKTTLCKPVPASMPMFIRQNMVSKETEGIQFNHRQIDIFKESDREVTEAERNY